MREGGGEGGRGQNNFRIIDYTDILSAHLYNLSFCFRSIYINRPLRFAI